MSMNIICYKCQNYIDKYQTCNQCKIATYCSTTCQTLDWSIHKNQCLLISTTVRHSATKILQNLNFHSLAHILYNHWSNINPDVPGYIRCEVDGVPQPKDPNPSDPLSKIVMKWVIGVPINSIEGEQLLEFVYDNGVDIPHVGMFVIKRDNDNQNNNIIIKLSVVKIGTEIFLNINSVIMMLKLPDKNNYVFM